MEQAPYAFIQVRLTEHNKRYICDLFGVHSSIE